MRCLMVKEWREMRALIYGLLAVAPLVSIGLRWWVIGWDRASHIESVQFIIPGFLGLFVVATAADVVAGDTGSGRIGFLAALPVRPTTVWLAKVTFVATGALVYLAWLTLMEWSILAAAGKDLTFFFTDLLDRTPWLLGAGVAGAAALLGSTLLDRSLSAALAGAAWLAAVVAVVLIYDPTRFGIRYRAALLIPCAAVLGPALLAASYLAFTRGRVHLGARARRLGFALAGFFIVAAPPAVATACALESWWHIGPDDRNARWSVSEDRVSPDGKWMLVTAVRRGRGPFGVWPNRNTLFGVSLQDARIRDLTGVGLPTRTGPNAWYPSPDRVRLIRYEPVPGTRGLTPLVVDYDLAAGRPLQTRAHADERELRRFRFRYGPHRIERVRGVERGHRVRRTFVTGPGRAPTRVPEGWHVMAVTAPWGIALHHPAGRGKGAPSPAFAYAVLELENGRVHEIPLRPSRLPATPDESVLAIDGEADGVLAVPLTGGKPHRVLDGKVRTHSLSPDGASLLVAMDRGVFLFVAASPVATRLEGGPGPGSIGHIRWSRDGKWFLITGPEHGWRGSTTRERLEPFSLPDRGRPIWFDGRRVVLRDRAARRLVLADANGRVRQLLPASP